MACPLKDIETGDRFGMIGADLLGTEVDPDGELVRRPDANEEEEEDAVNHDAPPTIGA